jgi:hypothetical protein
LDWHYYNPFWEPSTVDTDAAPMDSVK